MMIDRRDVELDAEGGLKLRSWPETTNGTRPAITMAHGYAGMKDRLNQRVQGSSPCAPTNDFNVLAGGIFAVLTTGQLLIVTNAL
jgi:hypothetical protein